MLATAMNDELGRLRATAMRVFKDGASAEELRGPLVDCLKAEGLGKAAKELEGHIRTGDESAGEGRVFAAVSLEEFELVQAFRDLVACSDPDAAGWARLELAAFKDAAEAVRPATVRTAEAQGPEQASAVEVDPAEGQVDTGAGSSVEDNPSEPA